MKMLFTADWHCCLKNLDRCEIVADQVVSILKAHPRTYFFHLGDIMGDRGPANPVDQRITNFLIRTFGRIQEVCPGFFFCRGNHDPIAVQDGSPSCAPLISALGASHVADDGWAYVELESGVQVMMVPYFRDLQRQKAAFKAAASAVNPRMRSILTFHAEVTGCMLNASKEGTGVTFEELGASSYDLCIGGHIHRPQKLGTNIYYVGSPFPCDWSEANSQKRFMLVEV